jgi:hypothetical protein
MKIKIKIKMFKYETPKSLIAKPYQKLDKKIMLPITENLHLPGTMFVEPEEEVIVICTAQRTSTEDTKEKKLNHFPDDFTASSVDDFESYSVKAIKQLCIHLGLGGNGKRNQMIHRLISHYKK